ncbi:hypothetical protein [Curtobacterium sp. PhB136]|uniref:hypothetical protein n=1 Tax=Curtobacterium sp. PhB136 TaxID=2485181 RepID=UPI001048203E|nr:hypothetical protein [Curtobacterium sp. PhB136]TCK65852.1 hypothetical protein EDF27_0595 [Curtobacterium sp. PhB136]
MKYRPVNVLPADWNRVKDFCRQAVLTYGPVNAKVAGEMLSTVTLFVLWATREEYAPLDYEGIFHPALMGRYLRSRVSNKNSSAYKSLHSRLFRIASAVADVDHNRKKRGRFAVPVHEYTAGELADLESWAATQRTDIRRRRAYTVLALMGGAGLWTKEALGVTGADVLGDSNGYSIRIAGRNPRVVPVLSDFAGYLERVIGHLRGDEFVLFHGGTPESRAVSLRTLYRGAHPSPNPQWFRDTWMLRQLRALPASIVMQAAGMPDVTTLRRYLPNASMPYEEWESALRSPAAYGSDSWMAAYAELRDDAETFNTKLRHEAEPGRQPVPRDRTAGGTYKRRTAGGLSALTADELRAQAIETDSTAFPAGTPAAPFETMKAPEQNDASEVEAADGHLNMDETLPRPGERLEAGWIPQRPRNESPSTVEPPKSLYLPALPEVLAERVTDDEPASAASEFSALREALLADARRTRRGGKR